MAGFDVSHTMLCNADGSARSVPGSRIRGRVYANKNQENYAGKSRLKRNAAFSAIDGFQTRRYVILR